MGMKKSGRRCRARARHHSDISTFGGGVRISRASLLAGASLVALVAFAAPDRAFAACSGLNRTISTPTTGPVYSNGGAITVTKSGSITGLDGVDVTVCPTTTLTNSGMISGGSAGANTDAAGGAGVSNSATTTITKLTNSGMIGGGGAGGNADAAGGAGCRTPARSRR